MSRKSFTIEGYCDSDDTLLRILRKGETTERVCGLLPDGTADIKYQRSVAKAVHVFGSDAARMHAKALQELFDNIGKWRFK